jgi:hypothetical protein
MPTVGGTWGIFWLRVQDFSQDFTMPTVGGTWGIFWFWVQITSTQYNTNIKQIEFTCTDSWYYDNTVNYLKWS